MNSSKLSSIAILATLLLIAMLNGCGHKSFTSSLDVADSLLDKSPEAAYQSLNTLRDTIIRFASRRERMRYYLLLAQAQNKTYRNILGIDTLRQLADYYNKGEDRMNAYYMMGSKYRDMGDAPSAISFFLKTAQEVDTTKSDSEFLKLGRVYNQIAQLYHEYNAPYLAAKYRKLSYYSFIKANHLEEAVLALAMQAGDYNLVGDRDSAKIALNKVISLANEHKEKSWYLYAIPALAAIALDEGNLTSAKQHLDIALANKDVFVSTYRFLEPLGAYYEKQGKPDSALYCYQKYINKAGENNLDKEKCYKGLARIYATLHQPDSALKYSSLAITANDSNNLEYASKDVSRVEALFNYTWHQQKAEQLARESRRKNMLLFGVILTAVFAMTLAFYFLKKQKQQLAVQKKNFLKMQVEYDKKKKEIKTIKQGDLNAIEQMEKELQKLKTELQKVKARVSPENTFSEKDLQDCGLVCNIKEYIRNRESIPETFDWYGLFSYVSYCLPDFYKRMRLRLTDIEMKACLLLRLHISSYNVQIALGIKSTQQMSNIRRNINVKLFNESTAKTLERNLYTLY